MPRAISPLLALAVLALAAGPLAAHTPVFQRGTVIANDDGVVVLSLQLTPAEAMHLIRATTSLRTRGDLAAQLPALRTALSQGLHIAAPAATSATGHLLAPDFCDDLASFEQRSEAADAPLPDILTFVLIWNLAPHSAPPRFVSTLYAGMNVHAFLLLTVQHGGHSTQQQLASTATLPDEERTRRPSSSAAGFEFDYAGYAAQTARAASAASAAATNSSIAQPSLAWTFVLGVVHIVPDGLDHILFVLGLFLAARRFRPLLGLVTAFTLAHSLTLAGVLLGVIGFANPGHQALFSRGIEIAIALSIACVALENLRPREPGWPRYAVVFAFGLIHGCGFASALGGLLPTDSFWLGLLLANLGIECGQLIVITCAALACAWWWQRPWYHTRLVVPASILLGICGLYWAVERIAG